MYFYTISYLFQYSAFSITKYCFHNSTRAMLDHKKISAYRSPCCKIFPSFSHDTE